jgi:hypothetical protein
MELGPDGQRSTCGATCTVTRDARVEFIKSRLADDVLL